MCQFVFVPTSRKGSPPNDPRRCKRPAWKNGWCKLHHPDQVRIRNGSDKGKEGDGVQHPEDDIYLRAGGLAYLSNNLNDAAEFRDKFDFIVKKVCEIQSQIGFLIEAYADRPDSGRKKAHVRPAEAAEMMGVSLGTFWRYAKEQPRFPSPMKPSSGCTLFNVAELHGWMESVRVAPKKARAGKTRGMR